MASEDTKNSGEKRKAEKETCGSKAKKKRLEVRAEIDSHAVARIDLSEFYAKQLCPVCARPRKEMKSKGWYTSYVAKVKAEFKDKALPLCFSCADNRCEFCDGDPSQEDAECGVITDIGCADKLERAILLAVGAIAPADHDLH